MKSQLRTEANIALSDWAYEHLTGSHKHRAFVESFLTEKYRSTTALRIFSQISHGLLRNENPARHDLSD
jgi:hypothetical protein